jgi:hypothetical protein
VRLLIDWAALQPQPSRPPQLKGSVSGCARTSGPCAPYNGVRDELAAIASQQRHGAGFEAVVVIYGTPAWAARPASGCERPGARAFSRAPTAASLAAYRQLIHALVALGEREGVALDWWAPWNEPNDPTFLAPQRSACQAGAPASSPAAYAELARAMTAQLDAEGGDRHLLLGELNAYATAAQDRVGLAEFVAGLPSDVVCASGVWSIHAYAAHGAFQAARDPVSVLEQALDARASCARHAHIWVTEAGAGAPHPGNPRPAGEGDELAACSALATQLSRWARDMRVDAVFQYTFRDDPAFPVGLTDAGLTRLYPAYRLWLAWAQRPQTASPRSCG